MNISTMIVLAATAIKGWCMPIEVAEEMLADIYGNEPAYSGSQTDGSVIQLWLDKERTGRYIILWSVIENGRACYMGSGKDWKSGPTINRLES
jgi:hypothetical protein